MATMTAFQLVEWGQPAEFREVEVPRPGPGDVLVKVAGVGLCHTDIHFLAPESNCDEVTGHIPAGLSVYAIGTLDDALEVVETVSAQGSTSELQTCPA